jgi:CRP/FNR family transcriptional regulator
MIQLRSHVSLQALNLNALKVSCANCSMHESCLPMSLDDVDTYRFDQIISRRQRIQHGEHLYRMHESFKNLYAIRFGHFKTYQTNPGVGKKITGFQMAGELLGLDAISDNRHHCDAVALEDSEVCEIPYARLEELVGNMPTLLHHFHQILSQEISREQNMLLLGNMRAEQRFADFLINLSTRYAARGYSPTNFQLRMSREDIANYLGLTIESISRLLTRFKKQELLKVDKREIQLLNPTMLKAMAAGTEDCFSA